MLLDNVYLAGQNVPSKIRIDGKKIKAIEPATGQAQSEIGELSLKFNEPVIAFPGLINSHDHLDFNLFPALGHRNYSNYTEWGNDIHHQSANIIQEVQKVPLPIRTQWGVYKNLLNGITTVVNHGDKLDIPDALLHVYQDSFVLHSVQFEKNWKWKLNRPFRGSRPITMHVGEGTDDLASKEIDELIRWNLFKRKITGIHGVAMTGEQADHFNALVWCPASNYFLLNETAPVDELKEHTTIIFGTDSTLTASWNLWEHLRLAKQTGLVSDEELLKMLTTQPAAVWGFEHEGSISKDGYANIVVARNKSGKNNLKALWDINPQDILLVMYQGDLLLFDSSLSQQIAIGGKDTNGFSKIYYDEICKYVKGDLPALVNAIKSVYPQANIPFGVNFISSTNAHPQLEHE